MKQIEYCQNCDYNPCMCGSYDYITKSEKMLREQRENEKRWVENNPLQPYLVKGP